MRNIFVAQSKYCAIICRMELRIGPPATGSNFYKRPALIAALLRSLRRGNVAFLGPRRTGKTSCLEEIKANPGEFLPVLLNLEKHDTVEAWLREMVDELRKIAELPAAKTRWATEKLAGLLGGIRKISLPGIGGIEIEASKAQSVWRKPADEFLGILAGCDLPVLFLIDGMYDRLKEAFTEGECRLAREVLKSCALTPDGLGREDFEKIHERLIPEANHRSLLADELDHVLDTLKHDGYLMQQTTGKQRTQFASNILRDFWLRKTT